MLQACLRNTANAPWDAFLRLAQVPVNQAAGRVLTSANRHNGDTRHDRVQDVFLSLCLNDFKTLRAFRGENSASLCAYLRTITRNFVITWLEKENRFEPPPNEERDIPVSPPPNDPFFLAHVERCLQAEKERDRKIFLLRHVHDYTPDQISRLPGIGLQKDAVETVLYRVKLSVAACLKKARFKKTEGPDQ